ncbi:hypothetical protein ACMGDF_06040 [Morganella morganii]|uniref:hypothetical protein n=1 Tax=Morganella morganii TaxID=582 RepID=UPI003EB9DE81
MSRKFTGFVSLNSAGIGVAGICNFCFRGTGWLLHAVKMIKHPIKQSPDESPNDFGKNH